MEVTGRLVSDAEVRKIKGNRELVVFTLVVNDYFKTKDGEKREVSEYFNCSYFLSTKIADSMPKGAIVTATGRVFLNEYKGKDGNKYASLGFHANSIKIISTGKRKGNTTQLPEAAAGGPKDDLPF